MKKLYFLLLTIIPAFTASSQVVISQIYGAGGNNGATYTNDFVELFNSGTTEATLTGYTLQYASATGTFNNSNIQTLPTITIPAGGYYLIQQSGGANGDPLPATPDLIPTVVDNGAVLAIAANNGKLVLASDNVNVTSPTDSNVVDYVGFGTATAFEGSGAAPAPSTTTSISRLNNGCTDTDNNAADFVTGTISPRNSSSPVNNCETASVRDNAIAGLKVHPNPVVDGNLYISTQANAERAIQIYDILGKQVVNKVTSNEAINVSNLKAGVYIVKITEEGKTASRKLVIN